MTGLNFAIFKKRIKLSLFCFCALTPALAFSQDKENIKADDDYVFEIKETKKYLHVDKLGLSENISVMDIIRMFPELLNRPTDENMLSSYDVQLDGISLGYSRDVVLNTLLSGNVKTITVAEDSEKSYRNNGQGGVIDIIPKKANEGLEARAGLTMNSLLSVMPSATLTYKKDKLQVDALCNINYCHLWDRVREKTNASEISSGTGGIKTVGESDAAFEMGRVRVRYALTKDDNFECLFSESFGRDYEMLDNYLVRETSTAKASEQASDSKALTIDATLKYNHIFKDVSKIKAEVNYSCKPVWSDIGVPLYDQVYKSGGDHNLAYKLSYVKPVKFTGCSLSIEAGVNSKLNFNNAQYTTVMSHCLKPHTDEFYATGNTFFLSPYLKGIFSYKSLNFNLNVAYQYFNYDAENYLCPRENTDRHDITGYLVTNWQIVPHHHLRLDLRRQLKRPTGSQIYSYLSYNEKKAQYFRGNSSLVPTMIHNVGLEYISDYDTKAGYFTLNVGMDFIHVGDVIVNKSIYEKMYGKTVMYTFGNAGGDNVFNVNAMLYYKIAFFNISLCGSMFNSMDAGNANKFQQYYTFSAAPYFTFPKEWVLTLQATYLSKVRKQNSELGDISYGKISVSKGWKNFVFSINGQIPFIKYTEDKVYADNVVSTTTYQAIYPYAGIAVNYFFR